MLQGYFHLSPDHYITAQLPFGVGFYRDVHGWPDVARRRGSWKSPSRSVFENGLFLSCLCFIRRFFQDDLFPSPEEIASEKHKRYWVNNNHMVRGQLILSHKWMLFLPSHVPAQNAQNAQVEFQFSRIFDLMSQFTLICRNPSISPGSLWPQSLRSRTTTPRCFISKLVLPEK